MEIPLIEIDEIKDKRKTNNLQRRTWPRLRIQGLRTFLEKDQSPRSSGISNKESFEIKSMEVLWQHIDLGMHKVDFATLGFSRVLESKEEDMFILKADLT